MEIDNNIPEQFKENQAYMSLLSRVSVRRYADKAVTPDQVSAILHAGMSAPSAVNKQPWEFIVVDKPELLVQLAAALPYAKGGSRAGGICCVRQQRQIPRRHRRKFMEAGFVDRIGEYTPRSPCNWSGRYIACLYLHEERMEPVRQIINIPDNMIPFHLIPVGYPDKEHAPIDKWQPERVHQNRF